MNITRTEYERIVDATNSEDSPWMASFQDYAVFPGDMRSKAEEMGVIEDVLWKKGVDHFRGNERFLLVNLDGDIEQYISADYSSGLRSFISLLREKHSDVVTEKGAYSDKAEEIIDKIHTLERALEVIENTDVR